MLALKDSQVLQALAAKLDRERPCAPKRRYATLAEAEAASESMHRAGKTGEEIAGKRLAPYHCRHCDGHHLGRGRFAPVSTPEATERGGNRGTVSLGEPTHTNPTPPSPPGDPSPSR